MYQVRKEDGTIVVTVTASSEAEAKAALVRRGYLIVGNHPVYGWIVVR